jgi:hypothetical protein
MMNILPEIPKPIRYQKRRKKKKKWKQHKEQERTKKLSGLK